MGYIFRIHKEGRLEIFLWLNHWTKQDLNNTWPNLEGGHMVTFGVESQPLIWEKKNSF